MTHPRPPVRPHHTGPGNSRQCGQRSPVSRRPADVSHGAPDPASAPRLDLDDRALLLEVTDTNWVPPPVVAPVEVTTVLGNLEDNAIEAARLGGRRPATVEVTLVADGSTLHLSVVDSGDGIPSRLSGDIVADGVSARDSKERGEPQRSPGTSRLPEPATRRRWEASMSSCASS